MKVFKVGECPVCPGYGEVIAIRKLKTNDLFFRCIACDCTWEKYAPLFIFEDSLRFDDVPDIAGYGASSPSSKDLKKIGINEYDEIDKNSFSSMSEIFSDL